MKSFVMFGLMFMGWGYWALSGGSDFVPQARQASVLSAAAERADAAAVQPQPQTAAIVPVAAPQVAAPASNPNAVAPPVFTPLSERRATLAVLAAAEAAERGQASLTAASLRPAADASADLRAVDADRVNLREGPGTGYGVLDQLTDGTVTEVLEYGTGNWVRVRVQGSGQSGWMSSRFLVSLD